MTASSIISAIQSSKRKYSEHLDYPGKPGMYAFFLSNTSNLETFGNGGHLIYIGISKDSLHNRDFSTHFKSGKSGSSTLRRSLGAILKEKLLLKAIPRGGQNDSKRFDNYKFTIEGEEKLSTWMLQNLEIGYWIFSDTMDYTKLRQHEHAVITELRPTLDLDRRTRHLNPLASHLTQLRQVCREEAKINSNNF